MMKNTVYVLAVVVLGVLAWPIFSPVIASQSQVTAPITVGWEIRPGGAAATLLPFGSPLAQHPSYHPFQDQITAAILGELPSDIRNAWPFNQSTVDANGHKDEEDVKAELEAALTALNERRDELAVENSLPDPPDFSLTSGAPMSVKYKYWNDTKTCIHTYQLSLGGVEWDLADGAIPATATFFVELAWDSRIN